MLYYIVCTSIVLKYISDLTYCWHGAAVYLALFWRKMFLDTATMMVDNQKYQEYPAQRIIDYAFPFNGWQTLSTRRSVPKSWESGNKSEESGTTKMIQVEQ